MIRAALTMLLMGLAAPAAAGLDEGKAAGARGDYRAAVRELEPLATAGDMDAELALAGMYRDARGATKSYERAALWFRRAAEQGSVEAQYQLAYIHYAGLVFPRDTAEMMRWLLAAALRSHCDAEIILGAVLEYGLEDVPVDLVEARKWYDLASGAVSGASVVVAPQALARISAKMSAAEIAESKRRAQSWRPAVDQGPPHPVPAPEDRS